MVNAISLLLVVRANGMGWATATLSIQSMTIRLLSGIPFKDLIPVFRRQNCTRSQSARFCQSLLDAANVE